MRSIFHRTSIRQFTNRKVEPEKIRQVLKAAMAAPSAGNQQPWEYYVVTNSQILQDLSAVHAYAGCVANAPVCIVSAYRKDNCRFPEFVQIDSAIAMENLWLACDSLGLGGVWIGIAPITERMEKVANILHLSAGTDAFSLFPMGYPRRQNKQPKRWDEKHIHYIE